MRIEAVIFDKDGTLFGFEATYVDWAEAAIQELSRGDPGRRAALAHRLGFDTGSRRFDVDSPAIAATNLEVAEQIAPLLPERSVRELELELARLSSTATPVPVAGLHTALEWLVARRLRLGVMTNDGETTARAQLSAAGIIDRFGVILGYDSGYGGKPRAEPLLAACSGLLVSPERAVMVGDSTHDLIAGRCAGMATVGVLTGLASTGDLMAHADTVLPDIGHLPEWIVSRAG